MNNVDGKKKMMCKLRWRAKYIKRPKKTEDAIFIHQSKNVWKQVK